MDGTVRELYLSQLHTLRDTEESTQQSLGSFNSNSTPDSELTRYGTTIAVVTEPTGGILDATDEHIPALGMPLEYLDDLRRKREELDIQDSVQSHNQAVENINLDQKYREYLETNDEAQQAIDELVSRVVNGETITLVCFEKKPKYCHRRTLQSLITQQAEEASS